MDTTERSATVRAGLIDHVADTLPNRRRTARVVGLVLVGALCGIGVSTGAFAATGMLTVPGGAASGTEAEGAVPAPPGVVPGVPVITLLGDAESLAVTEPTEVSMADRPVEATHVRVTAVALGPGSLRWGTVPGSGASAGWSEHDVADGPSAPAWQDVELGPETDTLYLTPSGFDGVVTVQYARHVPTLLGVNEAGQTYGVVGGPQGEPDLVAAIGVGPDGEPVEGYALRTDLAGTGPGLPDPSTDPDEAVAWTEEMVRRFPDGRDVPLYLSDGRTVIGTFRVGP